MTAIASPLDGTLMPLSEVPDPVFAQGLVGPGVAPCLLYTSPSPRDS